MLVHVAVEVDRELGQPEERAIDLDEPDFARPQRDATREAEVAVEPRVDERAAVHVDAELAVPGAAGVGARLHAQVRAVGVGADHDEARSGVGGHVPRDDRAAPDDERAAGRTVDGLTERLPAEARFGERAAADSAAWYGDGERLRNSRRSIIRRAPRRVRCRGGARSR